MVKSNKQGICPYCNSDDLEYGCVEFEGDMCYFPFTCNSCDKQGEEWYNMDFSGHNVFDEEGTNIEVSELLKDSEEC